MKNAVPVMPGVFFNIKTSSPSGIDDYLMQELYMDTCIMINTGICFASGNIRILFLGAEGLMFFVTGDSLSIRNTILFMSGCVRRVFSSLASKYPDMKIEESVESSGLDKFYL